MELSLNFYKYMLRTLLTGFSLCVLFHALASEKKIDDYYLIDSLKIESFSLYDQQIIDSCLGIYNQSNEPLVKIESLLSLINSIGDDRWGIFQLFLYEYIQTSMERVSNEQDGKALIPFLITSLNNLALMELDRSDFSAAEAYYELSLKNAIALEDSNGMANAYSGMSYMYRTQGDAKNALEYNTIALVMFEKLEDQFRVAVSLQNLANIYHMRGDLKLSIETFIEALELFEIEGHLFSQATCNSDLGVVYKSIGNVPLAVDCFTKSIGIYEKIGNENGIATSYTHLGDLYFDQGDYKQALQNYRASLISFHNLNFEANEAFCLIKIGNVLLNENKYDSALFYFQKALNIDKSNSYAIGMARANYNIGKLYFQKKEFKESLKYCKKALHQFEDSNHIQLITSCETKIAEIYFELDLIQDAYDYALSGLQKAQEFGDPELIKQAALILSKIGERMHDYKLAYEMYKLHATMEDSVENLKNRSLLIRTTIESEFQQKTQALKEQKLKDEITLYEQSQKIKEQKFWAFIFLSLAIIIALIVLWRKSIYESKIIWLKEDILKSQLKPHFMFNVLVSIQSLIFQSKYEDALFYLSEIASFMRSELNYISIKTISIQKEFKIAEQYLSLEKLRFKEKLVYQFVSELKEDEKSIEVPPLILQPLLENAIVHGFDSIDYQGEIKIKCRVHENYLRIRIEDNGRGLKNNWDANDSSKGLKIVQERLKLYNKKNAFSLKSLEKGVVVEIGIFFGG